MHDDAHHSFKKFYPIFELYNQKNAIQKRNIRVAFLCRKTLRTPELKKKEIDIDITM